ncbi:L-aspartate oxidase [Oscillatoria sp. CS-180]|uniref:L-aspartate oxidase n=1 Tax=Oscillatoria sp. CS-180 TaxID=3021720 RepID=UPI0023313E44|nr:L-aspartate oxidase [Oscillatoria sp. CS-180]MDB9526249.1 L-aspartate oxidase [Oscillatoria sp. CS-180]
MPIVPFDVLVIGSGAAGLYAALCIPSRYRIGLITKDVLSQSASDWAQGGIAAAIAPEDSPRLHKADTLQAGAGLCDPAAVDQLVEQGATCIKSLVEFGVPFDQEEGTLSLTLEAAHSRRRVLHAADATGRAVVSTLADAVRHRSNITVFEHTLALDLWTEGDRCQGVIVAHEHTLSWWPAGAVVVATGGGGQVFSQTTNPPASTGDGVAMGWRAGVQLRDLEFFQFHPTALKVSGAPRFLISEAVRGEGAHLIDAAGRRFAFDYHPQGELAPRDVVSRAIYCHLLQREADNPDCVWLDLRPIDDERIKYRFPNIIAVCQRWGIDLFQQPIPVSPAAHYWMGGIITDRHSHTTLSQLYAVGETASTGVHGANRLASNSLLECLVYGRQLQHLQVAASPQSPAPGVSETIGISPGEAETLSQIRSELPDIVWQGAGISRSAEGIETALGQLDHLRSRFTTLPITQRCLQCLSQPAQYTLHLEADTLRLWSETRNLLDLAHLILKSAHFRPESRGGHYREDHPNTNEQWQVHTRVQGDQWWT